MSFSLVLYNHCSFFPFIVRGVFSATHISVALFGVCESVSTGHVSVVVLGDFYALHVSVLYCWVIFKLCVRPCCTVWWSQTTAHAFVVLWYEVILVPRAAILLASATDRELWQGPKQEARGSADFCAASEIWNSSGYHRLQKWAAIALARYPGPYQTSSRGTGEKDCSSGDENGYEV